MLILPAAEHYTKQHFLPRYIPSLGSPINVMPVFVINLVLAINVVFVSVVVVLVIDERARKRVALSSIGHCWTEETYDQT